MFGEIFGLTGILAPEFSRAGIMEALKKRHHYGTTGNRVILDTRVKFDNPVELLSVDSEAADPVAGLTNEAMMGDILRSQCEECTFRIDVHGASPIERIVLRNGVDTLETYRPYSEAELGRRIRILWEGSEYRGRGRETVWDGYAELEANRFESLNPVNRYNLDKKFEQSTGHRVEWTALTTGGFGGFDAILENPDSGTLHIETALVDETIRIAEIGRDEIIFSNGGIDRRIRLFRLPDNNPNHKSVVVRHLKLVDHRDNALYVRVVFEDGHVAWSSPIYIVQ